MNCLTRPRRGLVCAVLGVLALAACGSGPDGMSGAGWDTFGLLHRCRDG